MNTTQQGGGCCAASGTPSRPIAVTGVLKHAGPSFSRVNSEWTWRDHLGQVRSRISAFRMNYRVAPGLYALGNPGPGSDVFASANYKLSFDILRRELAGMDAWILVLDTAGINVWCAAGKGTFGTAELIKRIRLHGLDAVVTHGKIIVPQLGAPGLEAHTVAQATGFRVVFGPVRASDIRAFVEAGYAASAEMRKIRFPILDRLVLTPMEINPAMKHFPLLALGVLFVFGLQPGGIMFREALHGGLPYVGLLFVAILTGAFITPALLPFIPFRSFALKGLVAGAIAVAAASYLWESTFTGRPALAVFSFLFFPALSSYLALQFTGATTYTGISGVKKELKISIPLYMGAAAVSVIFLLIFKLGEWGVI